VSFQEIVNTTVSGLGYELIETERSAGGLVRITIDVPWQPEVGGQAMANAVLSVEDCEKVTRQLQFALEVEAIEYRRLEVSSPGIDRPLRNAVDFDRFLGQTIDLTLKAALGAAAGGMVNANRKKFRGELRAGELPGQWQIAWVDEPVVDKKLPPAHKNRVLAGKTASKKRQVLEQVLGFTLAEIKEARLAPIVNFNGRTARPSDLE
jgi:ribosome maturation factor RimP